MDVAEVFQKVVDGIEGAAGAAAVEKDLVAEGFDVPLLLRQLGGEQVVGFGQRRVTNLEDNVLLAADDQVAVEAPGEIVPQLLHRRGLVRQRRGRAGYAVGLGRGRCQNQQPETE